LILLVGIAVFYFLRYKRAPNIATEEITLIKIDGSTTLLSSEIKGNTVIHFYASWCGPCRREMNEIKNNFSSLQAKNLNFVFLTDDTQDKITSFQNAMPSEIQFYRVESLKELGIYSIPTTYFYNEKKEITKKLIGAFSWSDSKSVEEVLSQMNK